LFFIVSFKAHTLQTYVATGLMILQYNFNFDFLETNLLCGLVVRVFGYRYRGPGFDSRCYQIF
jgi:hypothetical protein